MYQLRYVPTRVPRAGRMMRGLPSVLIQRLSARRAPYPNGALPLWRGGPRSAREGGSRRRLDVIGPCVRSAHTQPEKYTFQRPKSQDEFIASGRARAAPRATPSQWADEDFAVSGGLMVVS